jgi:hypothetical protein
MRILVFMSDNRPLHPTFEEAGYNSLAAAINYTYCKRHGYDFQYFCPYYETPTPIELNNCRNPTTGAPRHASWSKLLSSLEAMKNDYDYYLYIDSDCIFRNDDITIESIIDKNPAADVIFMNSRPWDTNRLCAGFYILKNTDGARRFLKQSYMLNIPIRDIGHDWEQTACRRVIEKTNICKHHLVDTVWFDEKEGQWLRHIGCYVGHTRVPYFRNIISLRTIDYTSTIAAIPYITFSTKDYRL